MRSLKAGEELCVEIFEGEGRLYRVVVQSPVMTRDVSSYSSATQFLAETDGLRSLERLIGVLGGR